LAEVRKSARLLPSQTPGGISRVALSVVVLPDPIQPSDDGRFSFFSHWTRHLGVTEEAVMVIPVSIFVASVSLLISVATAGESAVETAVQHEAWSRKFGVDGSTTRETTIGDQLLEHDKAECMGGAIGSGSHFGPTLAGRHL
jgi:hypothetical protein